MVARIAIVGVMLSLVVGCAKKPLKSPDSSIDSAANSTPPPLSPAKPADKTGNKDDQPNWLDDPRVKGNNGQLPVENIPGKQGWGATPPAGGWSPPQGPAPQLANPQPGPAPQPPPQPAPPKSKPPRPPIDLKPVAEADMKDVWIFIENRSSATGRMPRAIDTLEALIQAKSPAADLVRGGSIWITEPRNRESVWAFEYKTLTQGGLVVTQNGVETMTAAELARRLKSQ